MKGNRQVITVFGGTGHYGRLIVSFLLQKGATVRVLTRNDGHAREILGDKPSFVEGDITSTTSIREALGGTDGVVLAISAMQWKNIKRTREIERDAILTIFDEAKKAGISRMVYLSGYEIREDVLKQLNMVPFGAIKLEVERTLSFSDFNWTILGCAPSMELFFSFVRNGRMTVPGGGPPTLPTVSREDVGIIAAETVLRQDLSGRRFRLTGPEALSFPEAARRIGAITNAPVKVKKIPLFIIKVASVLLLPVNPFVRYVYWSLKLLNNFPQDLVLRVPADHQLLLDTFDYSPRTFDMEARDRYQNVKI